MPTSVFVFGGMVQHNFREQVGWHPNDIVARYANNLWYNLGKLAEPRNSHRSFEINGKILIFGGSLRYELYKQFNLYCNSIQGSEVLKYPELFSPL